MNLSEILKDWPEKEDVPHCDMHKIIASTYFNKAIDACDREIDREALAKELRGKPMRGLDYHDDRPYLELADCIISTMPTWLKRSEKK